MLQHKMGSRGTLTLSGPLGKLLNDFHQKCVQFSAIAITWVYLYSKKPQTPPSVQHNLDLSLYAKLCIAIRAMSSTAEKNLRQTTSKPLKADICDFFVNR